MLGVDEGNALPCIDADITGAAELVIDTGKVTLAALLSFLPHYPVALGIFVFVVCFLGNVEVDLPRSSECDSPGATLKPDAFEGHVPPGLELDATRVAGADVHTVNEGVFYRFSGDFVFEDAVLVTDAGAVYPVAGTEQAEFASGFEADVAGFATDAPSKDEHVLACIKADVTARLKGIADESVVTAVLADVEIVLKDSAAEEDVAACLEVEGVSALNVCSDEGDVFFGMQGKTAAALEARLGQVFLMFLVGERAPGAVVDVHQTGNKDGAFGVYGKVLSCGKAAAFEGETSSADAKVAAGGNAAAAMGDIGAGAGAFVEEGAGEQAITGDTLPGIHVLGRIEGEVAAYLEQCITAQVDLAAGEGGIPAATQVEVITGELAASVAGAGLDAAAIAQEEVAIGVGGGAFDNLAILLARDTDVPACAEGKLLALALYGDKAEVLPGLEGEITACIEVIAGSAALAAFAVLTSADVLVLPGFDAEVAAADEVEISTCPQVYTGEGKVFATADLESTPGCAGKATSSLFQGVGIGTCVFAVTG